MFEETPREKLSNLLKMMDHKGRDIMNQDPYYEHYLTAQWALKKGFIRKKTQEEIDKEVKKETLVESK